MTKTSYPTREAAKLAAALREFTGTEHWYRHPLFRACTYTDGVRHLAREAEAYWLIDLILSCQHEPKVKAEEFQVWTLTVDTAASKGVITCTNGNRTTLYRQEIGYTDFPLPEVSLWFANGVLYLPSEH